MKEELWWSWRRRAAGQGHRFWGGEELAHKKPWDWEKGFCSCAGYFSHPRAQQRELVVRKDVAAVPQKSSPHSLKYASPNPPPLTSKNCYDLKYFLTDGLPGVMFQCFLLKKLICASAYLNSDSAPSLQHSIPASNPQGGKSSTLQYSSALNTMGLLILYKHKLIKVIQIHPRKSMRVCSLEGRLLAPTSQESSVALHIVLFARDNLRFHWNSSRVHGGKKNVNMTASLWMQQGAGACLCVLHNILIHAGWPIPLEHSIMPYYNRI